MRTARPTADRTRAAAWKAPVLGLLLAGSLAASTGTADAATVRAAAPAAATVAVTAAAPSTGSTTMTATQWRSLKTHLDASSDLTRTVSLDAGVRTSTYRASGGRVFELREAARGAAPARETVSAGGCGFLQLCIYLTPSDQRAILAGAGAAIAGGICLVTGPAGCLAASVAVAVAWSYLNDRGVCSYRLRVRILPTVGGARCV